MFLRKVFQFPTSWQSFGKNVASEEKRKVRQLLFGLTCHLAVHQYASKGHDYAKKSPFVVNGTIQ